MTKVLAKDGRLAITEDKIQLLNILKEHQGEFVSGQELAEAMGLTRPAVWKDVQYFKELNYKIEARSNVGYRLVSAPDILHPLEFLPHLKADRFGRNCHYYRVIDSTNKAARRLLQKGVPDGTCVIAEYQSKGTGRLGRKWFSPFGKNIILSVILFPSFPASQAGLLALATGVSVAAAVKSACGIETDLLWPNDVLHQRRKMAGILIESSFRGEEIEHAVVGLGLNANSQVADFPAGLRDRLTSLREILGHEVSRQAVLAEFFAAFEDRLHLLEEGAINRLLEEWRSHAPFLGEQVLVILSDGKEVDAVAQDILKDGRLQLKTRAGEIHLDSAEFVYLKEI